MTDLQDMKFEQALAELETITQRLEEEELDLDEAIVLFERGQVLLKHCQAQLDAAELKIEQLSLED